MEVVDTVEVHIFSVPSEASPPHAKVEVGGVDPWDAGPVVLGHHVQDGVQVVDVPLTHTLIIQGARHVSSIEGRVECNVLPVLALHLVHTGVLRWAMALRGGQLLIRGIRH